MSCSNSPLSLWGRLEEEITMFVYIGKYQKRKTLNHLCKWILHFLAQTCFPTLVLFLTVAPFIVSPRQVWTSSCLCISLSGSLWLLNICKCSCLRKGPHPFHSKLAYNDHFSSLSWGVRSFCISIISLSYMFLLQLRSVCPTHYAPLQPSL